MLKKHKIITIILILTLCSIFTEEKTTNDYTASNIKKIDLQMADISRHNIFSVDNRVKYIGHRGSGGLAPENTIPAFELAGKLGFWGAECDVHTTSDGHWVILHDDSVDRMTNGKGKIKNLSLSKVQALNITSGKNIADYKGIKIPKLQDYLIVCKKWGLVPIIEMKYDDNFQYYDKFIKTIKKYGDLNKTVVISSSQLSLRELRKRNSYLTLGLICSDITKENVNFVKTLQNAFIDSSYHNITKSEVLLCHGNNIKVGVWTVDDGILANKLIQKGVDYLTTDKLVPEPEKQHVPVNSVS